MAAAKLTAKQERKIAEFEARADLLGHEFHACPSGRMVAQNAYGERMIWQVERDGTVYAIDETETD